MDSKAVVLYSTGTGNSYHVALWAMEIFKKKKIPCEVRQINGIGTRDVSFVGSEDFLGVSLPTHGFSAQWSVLKGALRLPSGKGCVAFVTACCGGMKIGKIHVPGLEGSAAWSIALILALKGYRVRAVNGVDMPANWIVVHPGFSTASAEYMSTRCLKRYSLLLDRVIGGGTFFPFRTFINLVLGIALIPVSLGYGLMGRFMLAKVLFADNRCNSCELCARICPVGGIVMRGGKKKFPRWSFNCESCMRCVGFCPTKAIEMNTLWFIGLLWLFLSGVPAFVDGFLAPFFGGLSGNGRYALIVLGQLVLLFPGGWLLGEALYYLARVPVINKFLMYTSLSRYYRRYRDRLARSADLEKQIIR